METIHMQAPRPAWGGKSVIEGHEYVIPKKDGVIKVVSTTHIETLKRHGFIDHYADPAEVTTWIEETEDKAKLVEFIEERGHDADTSMSVKKLRRLAREAAGIQED